MSGRWILIPITIGIGLGALLSCKKETLKTRQVYTSRDLEITFVDFTDSRCPLGTTCVWEGNASVSLEAVSEDQSVLFTLDEIGSDTVLFDHRITFVDLLPYPEQGNEVNASEKELILEVVKL